MTIQQYPVTLLDSKSGHVTIKMGGCFLHSAYNPIKEAEKTAKKHFRKNNLHILFGFGLGYLAKALFSQIKDTGHLFIIEPSEQLFQLALGQTDISELINSKKVFFCVGDEINNLEKHLSAWIAKGYLGKTVFIESPNYARLYPELLPEISDTIKEINMLALINVNTLHMFALDWQKNFILNLYPVLKAKPFNHLIKKLSCPVIIASGGPSLTKQLPLLQKVQNKALILCAGSAINSLLQGGVKPHAMVTIDGGEANYNHFKEIDIDDVSLIYELMVHHKIPRQHNGVQVVFNQTGTGLEGLSECLLRRKLGAVICGPSVANCCLSIASQLTGAPVCFIGQDLAYTGDRTHADGNKHVQKVDRKSTEKQRGFTQIKGYYGEQVFTSYSFVAMRKTFEKLIEHIRDCGDDRPVINATEGGAFIEGAQNMPFAEFIENYCQSDHTEEIEALFNTAEIEEPDWQCFYKDIQKENDKLSEVIDLCTGAQKKLAKVKAGQTTIPPSVLSQLNKTDRKLKRLLKNELMYHILQPVIFRVYNRYLEPENETDAECAVRVIKKSKALYKEIKEAAEHTKKYIDELLLTVKKECVFQNHHHSPGTHPKGRVKGTRVSSDSC